MIHLYTCLWCWWSQCNLSFKINSLTAIWIGTFCLAFFCSPQFWRGHLSDWVRVYSGSHRNDSLSYLLIGLDVGADKLHSTVDTTGVSVTVTGATRQQDFMILFVLHSVVVFMTQNVFPYVYIKEIRLPIWVLLPHEISVDHFIF